MAEFIMKYLIHKEGIEDKISVSSVAATTEEIGHDIYPPAQRELRKRGIPFDHRKARLFTEEDYEDSDFIIGMDDENLHDLMRMTKKDPLNKVHLLLDFTEHPGDVADPWYTGNFTRTYEDILKGCEGLLSYLKKEGCL